MKKYVIKFLYRSDVYTARMYIIVTKNFAWLHQILVIQYSQVHVLYRADVPDLFISFRRTKGYIDDIRNESAKQTTLANHR